MWCRVYGIGKKASFAKTEAGEVVIVPIIPGLHRGDIVAFEVCPAKKSAAPFVDAKFYAKNPRIIARKLTWDERLERGRSPVSRQRPTDACAWKQQKDEQEDAEALRAMRV